MTPESFLDLLEGVRPAWGYHKARCPAHEDRVQSLSIREGEEWINVKCFAGCTTEEILESLGLTRRDLNLDRAAEGVHRASDVAVPLRDGQRQAVTPSYSPRPADLSRFSDVYEYMSDKGEILYLVCRTHDKKFFQATPFPESPSGYIWGRRGWTVLYRLPEVLNAVKRGETIYVVEGEKDVHAIKSLGGVATCNPGGASKGESKWKPSYSEALRGARVVIVSDVDEVGKAHAEQIAQALEGIADVSLVYPKVGKDAHDHIEAGYGLDDFLERE